MLSRATMLCATACLASAAQLMPSSSPHVIEGEYIVSLHANITTAAHDALVSRFAGTKYSFGADFRALHAKLSQEELAWVLAQDHLVRFVEHNELVFAEGLNCPDHQGEPVSWGQVRSTVWSAQDAVEQVYAHDSTWGTGVDAYVLDTGIRCTHQEFNIDGNRCIWGENFAGGGNTDVNGHGTHCAGTIGGYNYGLSKSVTLIAVKVLGDSGSGSFAGIISGVQWALNQTQPANRNRPGVVNLSLGGSFNQAYSDACRNAVAAGLHVVTSGGNNNRDSCLDSPNNEPTVLTVGATLMNLQGNQQTDAKASFSNFGRCITLWAPGQAIISAGVSSDTAASTLSGTSMACPHVVGAVAALLTGGLPTHPNQIMAQLEQTGVPNAITGLDAASPNLLMHLQC